MLERRRGTRPCRRMEQLVLENCQKTAHGQDCRQRVASRCRSRRGPGLRCEAFRDVDGDDGEAVTPDIAGSRCLGRWSRGSWIRSRDDKIAGCPKLLGAPITQPQTGRRFSRRNRNIAEFGRSKGEVRELQQEIVSDDQNEMVTAYRAVCVSQ